MRAQDHDAGGQSPRLAYGGSLHHLLGRRPFCLPIDLLRRDLAEIRKQHLHTPFHDGNFKASVLFALMRSVRQHDIFHATWKILESKSLLICD